MSLLARIFRKPVKQRVPRYPLVQCCDCGHAIYNGETGYLVQTMPIGFTDEDTVTKLVCESCYLKRYGYHFLRTKYTYAYTEEELAKYQEGIE